MIGSIFLIVLMASANITNLVIEREMQENSVIEYKPAECKEVVCESDYSSSFWIILLISNLITMLSTIFIIRWLA